MGGVLRGGGFEAGGGMPAGRNVWEDRNALGLGVLDEHHCWWKLEGACMWCLGVIGTDELRVCRLARRRVSGGSDSSSRLPARRRVGGEAVGGAR